MKKYLCRSKFLKIVSTGALLLGILSGCAVQPDRVPPTLATTAIDVIPDDEEADALPLPDFGLASSTTPGPRIKRAMKPGLQDTPSADSILVNIPEPELDIDTREPPLTVEEVLAEPVEPPLADGDLWARIRSNFGLSAHTNPRVQDAAAWYVRHPRFFERLTTQAEPYLHYIVNEVELRGMPSEIALLPVVESAFQPLAYSHGRAAGLWQFIPDTGRRFGLKLNWWYDGRRDVVASTQAALDYLQYLHDTFDGDWLLALAAYNAGEGTVLRAMRENERKGKPTDFWSLRLPRETQEYVPRLLAISEIVAAPEERGVALKSIANDYFLTTLQVDTQLDLTIAAKLAGMTVEELHRLNPGFNRWATEPDVPHLLLLPGDKAAEFAVGLAALPPDQRVRWTRHQIRKGESLKRIAARYDTTETVLRRLNKLSGNTVRAGELLMVPVVSDGPVKNSGTAEESQSKKTHTVVKGDNLSKIARRYGVSMSELANWNGIGKKSLLRTGQILSIRVATPAPTLTAGPISTKRTIVYTVKRGDTLALISKRYDISVKQVKAWNGIKRKQRLRSGQRLTLHLDMIADVN